MRSWSLRTTGSLGSFLACSLCQRVQDDVGGEGLMRFFASLRMTWGCEALASHFPHSAILLSLVYFLHPHPIFLTLILRVEKSPLPSRARGCELLTLHQFVHFMLLGWQAQPTLRLYVGGIAIPPYFDPSRLTLHPFCLILSPTYLYYKL